MALDGFVGPVPGVEAMTTAPEWEAFFAAMFPSGVEAGVGNEFAPALDAGNRAIVIGSGRARLRAYVAQGTTSTSTPIDAADSQGRIDRLSLRLDRSATTPADWIKPKLIKSTPASSPVAPAYTNSIASNGVWDLPIARWTSAANGSLSGLVDERYKAPAPLIALSATQFAPTGIGIALTPDKVLASRDGSTWDTTLFENSGSVTLPPTGYWKNSAGFTCIGRRLNGWVRIRIAIDRTTNTLQTSDSDGSPLLAKLPANLRPQIVEYGEAGISGGRTGNVLVHTDGSVTLYSISSNIPVGAGLRATITYPGA